MGPRVYFQSSKGVKCVCVEDGKSVRLQARSSHWLGITQPSACSWIVVICDVSGGLFSKPTTMSTVNIPRTVKLVIIGDSGAGKVSRSNLYISRRLRWVM
jgi:hypothetical protein